MHSFRLRALQCFWILCVIANGALASERSPIGFAPEPEQPNGWMALPAKRPFPSLASDPRDLHTALRKNNKKEIEADVGSYRSLAGWKGEWLGEAAIFHAGIEGNGYFLMSQEGMKFPLHSSDGLIGLYGEAERGLWMFQLRYTHISAHLSDGLYSVRAREDYTREFAVLRVARQIGWLRAYAGYYFLTHTKPTLNKHSGQLGFYAIAPEHWGIAHPYFGGDLRIRSAEEGTNLFLCTGVAFVSSQEVAPVRLSISYTKGHDIRGQFFREKTEKFAFGLELDI